jgi:hypothetical protein
MKIRELQEAIKGWKHAASDIAKMRKTKSDAAKQAKLVTLKKDGSESKMHDAVSYFNSEQEARDRHASIVKLNPGRIIRHNLYMDNKFVEVLNETGSGGGTSSGAIASVANPFGIVMRRPSLFGYVPAKKRSKSRKNK